MAKKFRPKFAGGGVASDGVMGSPTGSGLAKRQMGCDNTVQSQSDADLEDMGMNHNLVNHLIETDAMCDVDENGVENKPQGVKEPGHSPAKDGYTKPLSSNLSNKISESTKCVDENFKEGAPLPTVDYNDGEGMEVSTSHGETVSEDEDETMTLEEAFEQYAQDSDEINYNSFAQHCGDLGYECPSQDDMTNVMSNDPYNIYEPNDVGGYKKTPIMLTINIDDLPPSNKMPPMPTGEVEPVDDMSPDMDGEIGPDTDDEMGPDMDDADQDSDEEVEMIQDMDEHPESVNERDCGVTESSVTTAQIAAPPATKPMIKKGKEAKSGNAATAVKGMKNHGENLKRNVENDSEKSGDKLKMTSGQSGNAASAVKGMKNHGENLKRDIKNDDSSNVVKESKGGFILPKSIRENVSKIMKSVNEAMEKVPSASRSTLSYRVVVESIVDNKKAATKPVLNLVEAAADAEELAVIGEAKAHIEVILKEGKEQVGVVKVAMPKLASRQPAINENGMLFRFKSLAERYAAVTITESAYQVKDHPYGALIKTEI